MLLSACREDTGHTRPDAVHYWGILYLSLFLIYVAQGCGYDYFWKLQRSFKADTPTFVSPGLCHVKSMYSLGTIGIKTAPINTFPDAIRIREVFGWALSGPCLSWPELCACLNLDFQQAWTEHSGSSFSVLWEARDRKHTTHCPISRGQDHLVAINLILMAEKRCRPSCPGLLASSGGHVIWIWLFIIFYIKSSFTFLCVTCSKQAHCLILWA